MDSYSKEDAISYVNDHDVKFIRLSFCDIKGVHKNISIMPQELERAFSDGIKIDYYKISKCVEEKTEEVVLVPDARTLHVLPWRPQTGRVVRFYCNIFKTDGSPFAYDTRGILRNALERCRQNGFSCRIGLHSEFYLFKTAEDGDRTDEPWDNGGYLDIAPLDRGENIRREICLALEDMGIVPETSYHEAGPGQNEIDFRASDAEKSADHFITYMSTVRSIAGRNGAYASFSPKPLKWDSGNGLHIQCNLHTAGEDLSVADPVKQEQFFAGVFNRMRDITVFLNASEESYERFGEKGAPKNITWSTGKQSRLFRVPVVDGRKSGFMLRSPDATMNPYLAFAVILEAGLCGIKNREQLPDELHADHTGGEANGSLPKNLKEAVKAAEESGFLHTKELSAVTDKYLDAIRKGL